MMTTITLSRLDGKKDAIPVTYPTLPDRFRVHAAFRTAVGFLPNDEKTPTGEYNQPDVMACAWAALGLCWAGTGVALPKFRDHGRDVIAYGEAVTTALWEAKYGDAQEQVDAGRDLIVAFMKDVTDKAQDASSDFPKAPRQRGK